MQKKVLTLLIVISLSIITGCNFKNKEMTNDSNNQQESNNDVNNSNEVIKSMKAIINGNEYIINLEDFFNL